MKKLINSIFDEKYLEDDFFNTLRNDYEGFDSWFKKSAKQQRKAFYIIDKDKVVGFVGLKIENQEEALECIDNLKPEHNVLKITTFKVDEDSENRRYSEILLKQVFDYSITQGCNYIYLTASNETKHGQAVQNFFEKQWDFSSAGPCKNSKISNDSIVYRDDLDTTAKRSRKLFPKFPITSFGVITIKENYHDAMFMSKINFKEIEFDNPQSLSITKSYVTNSFSLEPGNFYLIYRTKDKIFTHIAQISKIYRKNVEYKSIEEFKSLIKNKNGIYIDGNLEEWFHKNKSIVDLKIFTNIKTNNVTYDSIKNDSRTQNTKEHPHSWIISKEQIKELIKKGDIDERFIIDS